MKERVSISSGETQVHLETSDADVIEYFLNDALPKNHIPGYAVTLLNRETLDANSSFIFKHVHTLRGRARIVQIDKNCIEFTTSSRIPPGQFVFALLPIFENLYERKGLYGLHAACIAVGDWIVFILGDTKAGKSTLAAKLHYERDIGLITDERAVINLDEKYIYQGSSVISLRKEAIRKANIDEKRLTDYYISGSSSTAKAYCKPTKLQNYPLDLKKALFVFPRLDNNGLSFNKVGDFSLSYFLFENISQTIRSCISLFVDDSLPVPSQDNQDLSEIRAQSITRALKALEHKAFEVTGNIDEIITFIFQKTPSTI